MFPSTLDKICLLTSVIKYMFSKTLNILIHIHRPKWIQVGYLLKSNHSYSRVSHQTYKNSRNDRKGS